MAPDLPVASGGIKTIYRFVEHLNEVGHQATVWHGTPGFGYAELVTSAPVETGMQLSFHPGDVLVMPETRGSHWSFLSARQPVVMLCQGIDFVFSNSDFLTDEPGDYPGWPQATAAVAVSRSIEVFLRRACAPCFPLHYVPVEIEGYFVPRRKERRIALMPRRRREDVLGAVQLLRRSGRLADWEIVLIDHMSQAEVAAELGRAAIFLFGAEREGFGLPGAEAMAAGCYVVGFTGDGAKEYLLPQHSAVVPESDVVTMADRTLEAMRWYDEEPARLAERAERGRDFVTSRYNPDQVRSHLKAAFDEICAPGSSSLISSTVTLPHYQSHASPGGRWQSAYIATRRLAGRGINRLPRRGGA